MSRLFFISILVSHIIVGETLAESYQTLSVEKDEVDPALKEFSYDIGYGTEYFTAYVRPHIQQFSRGEHQHARKPTMDGHAVKFFNMSPNAVRLYWYVCCVFIFTISYQPWCRLLHNNLTATRVFYQLIYLLTFFSYANMYHRFSKDA